MCSFLQKGQSAGPARNRVPLHSHLQKQSTEELSMQQLNVYGCRGYLESVASNQNTKLPYTMITRVPFESAMIQFKSREPNPLRSYTLHQRACAWWHHSPTLLLIFRTSSWYLHQRILWEDLQHSQITAGDCWSCCKGMSGDRILQFCFIVHV